MGKDSIFIICYIYADSNTSIRSQIILFHNLLLMEEEVIETPVVKEATEVVVEEALEGEAVAAEQ